MEPEDDVREDNCNIPVAVEQADVSFFFLTKIALTLP